MIHYITSNITICHSHQPVYLEEIVFFQYPCKQKEKGKEEEAIAVGISEDTKTCIVNE